MNNLVTCVCESVYSEALTTGQKYTIVEQSADLKQIKIKGDNERLR